MNRKSIKIIAKQIIAGKALNFQSVFSTPSKPGLLLPSELSKEMFEINKDNYPVTVYIETGKGRKNRLFNPKQYMKSFLKYEGEWEKGMQLGGGGMPSSHAKPKESRPLPTHVKNDIPKNQAALDKDGVFQVNYGTEFIEESYAVAKDKTDLVRLIQSPKREYKGMKAWDIPTNVIVFQDPDTGLYWLPTGSFD